MNTPLRIVRASEFWAELAQERDAWRKTQGYRGGYKLVQRRCDECDHPVAYAHEVMGLCRRCWRRGTR